MWSVAATLNDNIIVALADFYSARKLGPGKSGDASAIAAGKALFAKGDDSRKVPPALRVTGPTPRDCRSFRDSPASRDSICPGS